MKRGSLKMRLPDGEEMSYGTGDEISAQIQVHDWNFFRKCAFYGDIGFGESFIDGDWGSKDLTKVIEWMLLNVENHPTLMGEHRKRKTVNFFKFFNRLGHLLRPNTLRGSRKNITSHYDLSNDFFKLFLDSTTTYSSAYFKDGAGSLEEAQLAKYNTLCKKLRLKSTDEVLEIGCGWGGFALYAAQNYGCKMTAITISQKQYEYTRKAIHDAGLSLRVDIQLKDYRHLHGRFDKILSIEMIEAVGDKFLKTFFKKLHQLLKPEGILALQMILSPDHRYESFKKNVDWIQKHIFPGSLLPSMGAIQKNMNRSGTLNLFDFEDITPSYVKTLLVWQENFNANLEKVHALGFDDAFIRKWNYYFCYCAGAFNMRNISVAQAVFSRYNNRQL